MSGHVLNEFVRENALPFLEDDNPAIRQAAALTCCHLFIKDPICFQASNHSIEIVGDVIDKLLTVGIADPGRFLSCGNMCSYLRASNETDPEIRLAVLSSLHERFDKHLAQAENVRSLFIALNDEVFENRLAAVSLIGRLAGHNPAYVMPNLRKALIQLLTELEYSSVMYVTTFVILCEIIIDGYTGATARSALAFSLASSARPSVSLSRMQFLCSVSSFLKLQMRTRQSLRTSSCA